MWRAGARVASRLNSRFASTAVPEALPAPARRYAAAAAAGGALATAAWLSTRQQEQKSARCDTDPLVLAGATVGGALLGFGAAQYSISSKLGAEKEKYNTYWPRKIMMLFGAPGAGKGTQGPVIQDTLGLPQLSTGDMLREAVAAGTEVGKKAKDVLARGELVSDEIVVGIIKDRIREADCAGGFILDGFPRTIAQAQALDDMLAENGERVSLVMAFDVDMSVLEERVCGRWMHKGSGRSYHVKFAPPKSMQLGADGKPLPESMKDDATGELLYQRSDDKPEALKSRLDSYQKKTMPVLNHYRPAGVVKSVNGGQSIPEVTQDVLRSLKK